MPFWMTLCSQKLIKRLCPKYHFLETDYISVDLPDRLLQKPLTLIVAILRVEDVECCNTEILCAASLLYHTN